MRNFFVALLLMLPGAVPVHGQGTVAVTITHFSREGELRWTNHLCATRPVYELVQANSVTGAWQHVTFLTNATSLSVSNLGGDGASMAFYRIVLAHDEPVVFDYTFEDVPGCPSVLGRLEIGGVGSGLAGHWTMQPAECYQGGGHPLGSGTLWSASYATNRLRVYLVYNVIDGRVWLDGTLERSDTTAACTFTRYSGAVYAETIVGAGPIGNFVAVRAPP